MTDYTDLQKAAEYAAQDTIKFADEEEEMRALQQFHEEVDPETVLALIAENQAMAEFKAHMVSLREAGGFDSWSAVLVEIDQLKAENERLTAELDCPFRLARHSKRLVEQLREENAALRKERDARHPFKPSNEPAIGYSDGCMVCGQWGGHFGLPCPKTRATAQADLPETRSGQIGAPIGKGEQS